MVVYCVSDDVLMLHEGECECTSHHTPCTSHHTHYTLNRGVNVRHRAAALLSLLHDHERLRAERVKVMCVVVVVVCVCVCVWVGG